MPNYTISEWKILKTHQENVFFLFSYPNVFINEPKQIKILNGALGFEVLFNNKLYYTAQKVINYLKICVVHDIISIHSLFIQCFVQQTYLMYAKNNIDENTISDAFGPYIYTLYTINPLASLSVVYYKVTSSVNHIINFQMRA